MTRIWHQDDAHLILAPDDTQASTLHDGEMTIQRRKERQSRCVQQSFLELHRRLTPASGQSPIDDREPGWKSHPWRWLAAFTTAGTLAACLLSGAAQAAVSSTGAVSASSSSSAAINCLHIGDCYTPSQFRAAYGIQPLLNRGIDGRGETVVLPELAAKLPASPQDFSDIRQDLARFDSQFGLPAAQLKVVTSLAGSASPWLADGEAVEDIEMVHAVAPDATIRVILVSPTATANAGNFTAAVTGVLRLGLSGSVISISGSFGEHFFTPAEVARLHSALQEARDRHVTVVASSGDTGVVSDEGTVKEVSLPASDPLVLAVGGTTLVASPSTGDYSGEMAWNTVSLAGSTASAGGFSNLFSRPSYQDGVTGIGTNRGVPDVAADADPVTGLALVTSDGSQKYSLKGASGTSAATPFWSALIALADQEAGRHLGFVNAGIYRIGLSASYHSAFHDVTTGDNSVIVSSKLITGYQALSGWDPVTGWGSPNAQVLVPLLAHQVQPDDGQGL
jgi:subtilase family serine protease